jgi:predicted lipoprotein with Yx(FWY)xxD motif
MHYRAHPAAGAGAHVRRLWCALIAIAALLGLATTSAFAASSTVNATTTASFGTVLTDAQGFALYTLPTDHNGMSSCTGSCVPVWPALTVPAGTTPTAGPGVSGTVAAVLQSNGADQVTYNGDPLYTFVGDTSPGQVTGNNVGGFKVAQIAAPTSPSTTVATTTPGGPPASSPSTSVATAAGTPTTQPPAAASAGAGGAVSATAATGSGSTGASAPSGAVSSAPSALAVTGPGPALAWMVIAGAGLLVISGLMLLAVRRRERQAR